MLPVDVESDDFRFNKTLHQDILLKPDEFNDKWDIQFDKGDLVNITGHDSLKNAICIAIMTRYQELSHNKLYADFGCRVHELIKANKSMMTARKIEYFVTDVLKKMRRVYKINEITVTDNHDNNGWKYLITFSITSINDEIITGSVGV